MTAEAALLGVPTFSCYLDKLTNEFEDPIKVILKTILNVVETSQ